MILADPWNQLFADLEALSTSWPGGSSWSYDGGLKCVLCVVPTTQMADADAQMARVFTDEFAAENVANAPEAARALAEDAGGLRPGQGLRWRKPRDAAGAFALIWPWGNGAAVSIRIGLHGAATTAQHERLRQVFGAQGSSGN